MDTISEEEKRRRRVQGENGGLAAIIEAALLCNRGLR
jgi:hypothetical protein